MPTFAEMLGVGRLAGNYLDRPDDDAPDFASALGGNSADLFGSALRPKKPAATEDDLIAHIRSMPPEAIEEAPHGALQWALEGLDAPRNLVANVLSGVSGLVGHPVTPSSKIRAFGLNKVSSQDLLKAWGVLPLNAIGDNAAGKTTDFLTGFLADVATDPLSWLTGGLAAAAKKVGRTALTEAGAKALETRLADRLASVADAAKAAAPPGMALDALEQHAANAVAEHLRGLHSSELSKARAAAGITEPLAEASTQVGRAFGERMGRHLLETQLADELAKEAPEQFLRKPGLYAGSSNIQHFNPFDLPYALGSIVPRMLAPGATGAVDAAFGATLGKFKPFGWVPDFSAHIPGSDVISRTLGAVGKKIGELPVIGPLAGKLGEFGSAAGRELHKLFSTEPAAARPGDPQDWLRYEAESFDKFVADQVARKQREIAYDEPKWYRETLSPLLERTGIPAESLDAAAYAIAERMRSVKAGRDSWDNFAVNVQRVARKYGASTEQARSLADFLKEKPYSVVIPTAPGAADVEVTPAQFERWRDFQRDALQELTADTADGRKLKILQTLGIPHSVIEDPGAFEGFTPALSVRVRGDENQAQFVGRLLGDGLGVKPTIVADGNITAEQALGIGGAKPGLQIRRADGKGFNREELHALGQALEPAGTVRAQSDFHWHIEPDRTAVTVLDLGGDKPLDAAAELWRTRLDAAQEAFGDTKLAISPVYRQARRIDPGPGVGGGGAEIAAGKSLPGPGWVYDQLHAPLAEIARRHGFAFDRDVGGESAALGELFPNRADARLTPRGPQADPALRQMLTELEPLAGDNPTPAALRDLLREHYDVNGAELQKLLGLAPKTEAGAAALRNAFDEAKHEAARVAQLRTGALGAIDAELEAGRQANTEREVAGAGQGATATGEGNREQAAGVDAAAAEGVGARPVQADVSQPKAAVNPEYERIAKRQNLADARARAADDELQIYARSRGYRADTDPDLLEADVQFQALLKNAADLRSAANRNYTRAENVLRKQSGIEAARAGRVTMEAIKYAPLDTLPQLAQDLLRAEARNQLAGGGNLTFKHFGRAPGESTAEPLRRIIAGGELDRGADVAHQKQRLARILLGDLDQRSVFLRQLSGDETKRPPSELFRMLLRPEERADVIGRELRELAAGRPGNLSRDIQSYLTAGSGEELEAESIAQFLKDLQAGKFDRVPESAADAPLAGSGGPLPRAAIGEAKERITPVFDPDGRHYRTVLKVVDADTLKNRSVLVGGVEPRLQSDPNFPEALRGQRDVIADLRRATAVAERPRRELLLNESSDPDFGPPIVTADGHVVAGGNALAGMRTWGPGRWKQYARDLKAAGYEVAGLPLLEGAGGQAGALQRPILVRMLDEPPERAAQLVDALGRQTDTAAARARLSGLGHADLRSLPPIDWANAPPHVTAANVDDFFRTNADLHDWLLKHLSDGRRAEVGNAELARYVEDVRGLTQMLPATPAARAELGVAGRIMIAPELREIAERLSEKALRTPQAEQAAGVPARELSTNREIDYLRRVATSQLLGSPESAIGNLIRKAGKTIKSGVQSAREAWRESFVDEANNEIEAINAELSGKGAGDPKALTAIESMKLKPGEQLPAFAMNPLLSHVSRQIESMRLIGSADFLSEAAARYGVRVSDGKPPAGFTFVNARQFGGLTAEHAFPPEVAKLLESHMRQLQDPSPMLSGYRSLLKLWKGYALMAPAYHLRNLWGNVWNASLLGGYDAAAWNQGRGVLQAMASGRGLAAPIPGIGMTREQLYRKAFVDAGAVGSGFFGGNVSGTPERVESLLQAMDKPASARAAMAELKKNRSPSQANMVIGRIGEESSKLGFLITRLRAGDSFEEASEKLNKALFDYGDLTSFERGLPNRPGIKDVIPFYAWSKFNSMLLLQTAFTNPSRLALIPKIQMEAEQAAVGDEALPPSLRPAHVSEEGGVQVSGGANPRFVNLGYMLPFGELRFLNPFAPREALSAAVEQIGGPARTAAELAGNYDAFFRRPIREYEGQRKDFLGVPMPPELKHVLRTIRPLNALEQARGMAADTTSLGGALSGAASQVLGVRAFPVDVRRQIFEADKRIEDQVSGVRRDMRRRLAALDAAGSDPRADGELARLAGLYGELVGQREALPLKEARAIGRDLSRERRNKLADYLQAELAKQN